MYIHRLKSAVSASKLKIAQQAQIISEQTILLRKAGRPHAFVLSDHETQHISKGRATRYRGVAAGRDVTLDATGVDLFSSNHPWLNSATKNEDSQDSQESHLESHLQLKKNSCHIMYSHTHNQLCHKPVKSISSAWKHGQGTGAAASTNLTLSLSLKSDGDSSRVRYREQGSKRHNVSSPLTSLNNKTTTDGDDNNSSDDNNSGDSHTTNEEDFDSIPASPSLLSGSGKRLSRSFDGHDRGVGREGDEENPLGLEDEPMSCSMFTTCPTTRMAGATLHQITPTQTHSVIPRKRPLKVDKIADLLSNKRARNESSPGDSIVEGDVHGVQPVAVGVVDVVPVTPGVRSVKNILDSGGEGWLTAQPAKRQGGLEERKDEEEGMFRKETGGGGGHSRTKKLAMAGDHLMTTRNTNNRQQQKCEPPGPKVSEGNGRLDVLSLLQKATHHENKTASNQIHQVLTSQNPQATMTGNASLGGAQQSTSYNINELVFLYCLLMHTLTSV